MNQQLQTAILAAQDAGFRGPSLVIAVAVAWAESSLNPNNRLVTAREDSRGLWQINTYKHPEYAGVNLYDPLTNAKAAFALSNGGTNWHPWTTFTSGDYMKYLPQVKAAMSSSGFDPCALGPDGTPLNTLQRFACQIGLYDPSIVDTAPGPFDNSGQNFEGLGGVDQPGGPVPDSQKPGAAMQTASPLADNVRLILVNVAGIAIILVVLSRML